jgi:hypothetical protein
MIVKLTPQSGADVAIYVRTLQNCIDHLQSGADYRIWGDILRMVGTRWCEKSQAHDVKILSGIAGGPA